MKKVLILGVASVQMDAVLQLKKMNCEVYTCAMKKDGPAADVSDHFAVINITDEKAIEDYIIANNIDAVYSTGSDLAMPIACRLSEKLGLPHFVSSETAYICNHKNAMRETLTSACKGNIPYQVLETPAEITIGFPAILKPSDSQGQRGIFLVQSQEEFLEHFDEAKAFSREGKVIVEKYIDGPEISVNGYMINGVLRFVAASDRETWPEFTGLIHKHIVPAVTISETAKQNIKNVLEDACNRVGLLNGPVYFQMKVMDEQPYIIEMTPRLDGCHMWKLLMYATGVNLMQLTFKHLLEDDTSELSKCGQSFRPMELEFWCQVPGTVMDQSKLLLPEDAIEHFYYYNTGDTIRPVNGKYDKIGYFIRNLE